MKRKSTVVSGEEGSGLVLTLMVLLVLSVLGASIGVLTLGSFRLSDINRDDTSAYYIAEAGAKRAYEDVYVQVLAEYHNAQTENSFYNNVNSVISSIDGEVYQDFETQFGDSPEVAIEIKAGANPQEYIIQSTGIINRKKRVVEKKMTVKWFDKDSGGSLPELPKNASLLADKKINLLNGTLIGNAYISSKDKNSVKLAGGQGGNQATIFYPKGVSYEDMLDASEIYAPTQAFTQMDVTIPWTDYRSILAATVEAKIPIIEEKLDDEVRSIDDWNSYNIVKDGSIYLNSYIADEYNLVLRSDIYVPKIDIDSGKTLKINPNGGNYIILVDDLSVLSGNLDIVGEGSVMIIVTNSIQFNQASFINQSGRIDQLLLKYTGDSPNFSDITSIRGNIVSVNNNANITITNSSINGVFLTDNPTVSYTGGNKGRSSNMVMIAPNSDVILESGYNIDGTIIANRVTLNGGGQLRYKEIDTSSFTSGSSNGGVEVSPEDIISSEPIVEAK
ncbi:PilX N-terminal domain-containing pilus assembly protein [Jeotgalibaca ciconiae]|uniref:Type 4 fimbrial biogenesis protein PilX N-terminal domain-containing protein n=1 Tax=Jeotgalibaca ciconiae TaxID=2496265 RepID=A0A3Q9BJF2_9LACT|nr:PilX N-terminal domain-containing pilus assembly protein [Jeotgalibaca ciconiae]AZP03677.1 hypothetical protein EJN90_02755 [Jeotgalibaca ciconiae]